MGNHPVMPDRESTHDLIRALIATLPEADRPAWERRWQDARSVDTRRRDYDRSWDDSLRTVGRAGQ